MSYWGCGVSVAVFLLLTITNLLKPPARLNIFDICNALADDIQVGLA
jgi:hypothetical protein